MQFYFYRIDRKIIYAKWSRVLALLLRKEKLRVFEGLILEVLKK
jgi:hypothetical protein